MHLQVKSSKNRRLTLILLTAALKRKISNLFRQNSDTIFFGDSLTEGFPFASLFNSKIENWGLPGSTTADLRNSIDNLTMYNPKKVFIMAGINDIGVIDKNQTFKNIEYIITKIIAKSPNTSIYLQSILPVSDPEKTKQIKDYNAWLSAFAAKNHVVFIDIFSKFLYKDTIDPKYTFDGTHLLLSGYQVWRNCLSPYID